MLGITYLSEECKEIIQLVLPCGLQGNGDVVEQVNRIVAILVDGLKGVKITHRNQSQKNGRYHIALKQGNTEIGTYSFCLRSDGHSTILVGDIQVEMKAAFDWSKPLGHRFFKEWLTSTNPKALFEQGFCVLGDCAEEITMRVAYYAPMCQALERSQSFDQKLMEGIGDVLTFLSIHDRRLGRMLEKFISYDKNGLFISKLLEYVKEFETRGILLSIVNCIYCHLQSVVGNVTLMKRFSEALQYLLRNYKPMLESDIQNVSLNELQKVIQRDSLGLVSEIIFNTKLSQNLSDKDLLTVLESLSQNLNQAVGRDDQASAKRLSELLESFLNCHRKQVSRLIQSVCHLNELQTYFQDLERSETRCGFSEKDGFQRGGGYLASPICQTKQKIEYIQQIKDSFYNLFQSDRYGLILQAFSGANLLESDLLLLTDILTANRCVAENIDTWVVEGVWTSKGNSQGLLKRRASKKKDMIAGAYSKKEEDVQARCRESVERLLSHYHNRCVKELKKQPFEFIKQWIENGGIPFSILQLLLQDAKKCCGKVQSLRSLSDAFSQEVFVRSNNSQDGQNPNGCQQECKTQFWKYFEDKLYECAPQSVDAKDRCIWVQQQLMKIRHKVLTHVQKSAQLNGALGEIIFLECQQWLINLRRTLMKSEPVQTDSTCRMLPVLQQPVTGVEVSRPKDLAEKQVGFNPNAMGLFPFSTQFVVGSSTVVFPEETAPIFQYAV